MLLYINISAAHLPTPALAAIWLALWIPIAHGLWTRARAHRSAWLSTYLHPDGRWHDRLSGGPVMALVQGLLAGGFALALMVGAARLEGVIEWRLLLTGLPLLVVLRALIQRRLSDHVNPRLLDMFSWRIAMGTTGLLLLAGFTLSALWRGQPDYSTIQLGEAIWRAIAEPEAKSDALLGLLQLGAAKDAFGTWLGQRLIPSLGAPWFQFAGWSLLFAANGLFIWAWMNLCSGLLGLVGERRIPTLETAQ
ncbi:hypothetical protein A5892_01235 [Halotalea alkalilenta]|uniref:Uncharacterized protein n=2 Tax=Halotalea alkalilenta TaxID=376489 RepID=A0A172YB64_9GAMM|nr:hypothetical protein A5892_01235 [Halotalea alkalilenta]